VVELLGVWFLDEPAVHNIILSTDLLPGGQGRVSDAQWYLSPSEYLESAFPCYWLRNTG